MRESASWLRAVAFLIGNALRYTMNLHPLKWTGQEPEVTMKKMPQYAGRYIVTVTFFVDVDGEQR